MAKIENGAIIYPGVVVGEGSIVRADAVVDKSIPPHCEVSGNPAQIVRHLNPGIDLERAEQHLLRASSAVGETKLAFGCSLHTLGYFEDIRGELIYGCSTENLPFTPVRVFITNVASAQTIRGEHAHRTLCEFLLPISGSLRVALTDGAESFALELDSPNIGLFIPTGVWSCQYSFSENTSLLVLASEPYKQDSYIRSFDQFLEFRRSTSA